MIPAPGRRATVEVTITEELIDAFASLSGDDNALHVDAAEAMRLGFPGRVAHGALSVAFLSRLIGTKLPGPGALWQSLKVTWLRPVFPGDRVTFTAEVARASAGVSSVLLGLHGTNQNGVDVLEGEATVTVLDVPASVTQASSPAVSDGAGKVPRAAGNSGRAVLVTGGSGGIGRAIALELASLGYPVLIGYCRSGAAAEAVVREIESRGGRAASWGADLAGPFDPETAREASSPFGRLVGLVHAASRRLDLRPADDLDPAVFEEFWRISVGAGVVLVRSLFPTMKEAGWGRVVFLGTSALFGPPPPRMGAYLSAKSALVGFAKSLALELGPAGVTVNVVSPSLTPTDLTRDVSPRVRLAEAQRNPRRRLAHPEDTARAVAFLFGDGADFVNGTHLPVSGGSVMP